MEREGEKGREIEREGHLKGWVATLCNIVLYLTLSRAAFMNTNRDDDRGKVFLINPSYLYEDTHAQMPALTTCLPLLPPLLLTSSVACRFTAEQTNTEGSYSFRRSFFFMCWSESPLSHQKQCCLA